MLQKAVGFISIRHRKRSKQIIKNELKNLEFKCFSERAFRVVRIARAIRRAIRSKSEGTLFFAFEHMMELEFN